MPTTIRTALVLLLSIAALAACSAPAALDLAGREFLSVAVIESGAARALVAGTRISVRFGEDGNVGANAGCNGLGGTYRIDGGRLVFEGGGMTEMGCDPERHAQDDWLVDFLASKPAIRLAGDDLTLESGSTVVRLLDREVAEPDLNLVGPTWTVESIIAGDAVSSAPAGAIATLVFKADGTVDVNAGCNRGTGTWQLDGAGIKLGPIGLTKMACDGAAGDLEAAVLPVLGGGTLTATIDGNALTLSNGSVGLQLRG